MRYLILILFFISNICFGGINHVDLFNYNSVLKSDDFNAFLVVPSDKDNLVRVLPVYEEDGDILFTPAQEVFLARFLPEGDFVLYRSLAEILHEKAILGEGNGGGGGKRIEFLIWQ